MQSYCTSFLRLLQQITTNLADGSNTNLFTYSSGGPKPNLSITRLKPRYQHGHTLFGDSKGKSIPHLFSIPWLVPTSLQSPRPAFSNLSPVFTWSHLCLCQISFCPSLTIIPVTAFRPDQIIQDNLPISRPFI